jgi:hypothetical protein
MLPLSINAKTLELSSSIARPYDCQEKLDSAYSEV